MVKQVIWNKPWRQLVLHVLPLRLCCWIAVLKRCDPLVVPGWRFCSDFFRCSDYQEMDDFCLVSHKPTEARLDTWGLIGHINDLTNQRMEREFTPTHLLWFIRTQGQIEVWLKSQTFYYITNLHATSVMSLFWYFVVQREKWALLQPPTLLTKHWLSDFWEWQLSRCQTYVRQKQETEGDGSQTNNAN